MPKRKKKKKKNLSLFALKLPDNYAPEAQELKIVCTKTKKGKGGEDRGRLALPRHKNCKAEE